MRNAKGSRVYRRINAALFLGGFATFTLLYCPQPLLPVLAATYRISPTVSALAVSLTTGLLAISSFLGGAVSEITGRQRLMAASLLLAALCNIGAGLVTTWGWLLVWRALEGVVLGGVPAVVLTYLSEEIQPQDLGHAMGLYVGGSGLGGMAGRVLAGYLAETFGWQTSLLQIGILAFCAAIAFAVLLPKERNFVAEAHVGVSTHLYAWWEHLKNGRLMKTFVVGSLSLGSFVTIYNYIGFRLEGAPFLLGQKDVALIFLTYIVGVVVSPLAGRCGDRWGRPTVLSVAVSIWMVGLGFSFLPYLPGVIVGVALITAGFFATQTTVNALIGLSMKRFRGHAASLYLLLYYSGSSIMGYYGGWFWTRHGWLGIGAFTATAMLLVAFMGFQLRGES